jgi:Fe2+-dicitrate sensor, membrane component
LIPVSSSDSPRTSSDSAEQWLARRDRGLSPAEQDAYLQWLREDPRRGLEIARLEKTWQRLDALRRWQPVHSPRPNPDLLAPARRFSWQRPTLFAVAAAVVLLFVLCYESPQPAENRSAVLHPGPERQTLSDGSLVELNAGAEIEVNFTDAQRSVRLLRGEAHFAVAKDPARPFVVTAAAYQVRAVGTAFSVDVNEATLAVLVTEGKVQLDELHAIAHDQVALRPLSPLVAGQKAVVQLHETHASGDRFHVSELTPAEIETALSWQRMRLEFTGLPLRDVIREFNRYNSRKLVIEDADTGNLIIAGSFRADNVETFVRLLDAAFGIEARSRGTELVLVRRR